VAETLRKTPLHAEHVALAGRMVPFAGWEMPVQYEGVVAEHVAVRTAAGIFDVSHMGEVELRGPHAAAVVDWLVTNDTKKLEDGRALYTVACNEAGTILDDLIVYRRGPEDWLVVCNASNREKIAAHFARACENHCEFEDVSDATALLALQGPKAMAILGALGAEWPAALPTFGHATGRVADVDVRAARTGYTGEDGVELFCASDRAPALWRAILEAGRPMGCKPAGLGARDTLRLEAKLCLYGNDIDETTTPLEAGLGWVVKLAKGDFVGRAALEAQKAAGLSRKLVGFEMRGRGIGRHGYPIVPAGGGAAIGTVTSGGPSPTLGKNIGLGYVPAAASEIGTKIGVEIRGSVIDAEVVKTPFYKREGSK
jgi:aminomethyltransferase